MTCESAAITSASTSATSRSSNPHRDDDVIEKGAKEEGKKLREEGAKESDTPYRGECYAS